MEISRDEFNSWLNSNVTKKLIATIQADRDEFKDGWEMYGYTAETEAASQGACNALFKMQQAIETGNGLVDEVAEDGNA